MNTQTSNSKRNDPRPPKFTRPSSMTRPQSLNKPAHFKKPVDANGEYIKNPIVYIGNLNYNKDMYGIMDMFKPFGYVEKVNLIRDEKTEASKGIAFVEMQTKKAAAEAVAELNGKVIDGRTVKVSIAKEREDANQKAPNLSPISKNEAKSLIKKGKVKRTGLDLLFEAKRK